MVASRTPGRASHASALTQSERATLSAVCDTLFPFPDMHADRFWATVAGFDSSTGVTTLTTTKTGIVSIGNLAQCSIADKSHPGSRRKLSQEAGPKSRSDRGADSIRELGRGSSASRPR